MLCLLIRIIKVKEMSRIGNSPIELPQGVSISFGENNSVVVKENLVNCQKNSLDFVSFNQKKILL